MTSKIYYWLETGRIDIIIFCNLCNTEEFEQLKKLSKLEKCLGKHPLEVKDIIDTELKKKSLPFVCEAGKGGICFYRIAK